MRVALCMGLLLGGCKSEQDLFDPPVVDYGDSDPKPVDPTVRVDRVTQSVQPAEDILFVVDNSCSMNAEQQGLSDNFPVFLNYFLESELDFHIGVASTDMNNPLEAGRLQFGITGKWVDASTPAPEAEFSAMAVLGTEGHATEQGRAAAYTALEVMGETENAGFLREDAGLHIAVISDEDDESGDSPVSRDEFVEWMKGVRWSPSVVSFSSIVAPAVGCPNAGEPGVDYLAVTSEVGGISWPICDPDWSEVLESLGREAIGLEREFFLSRRPLPESIEVGIEIEGALDGIEASQWAYNEARNSIEFNVIVPPERAIVQITYVELSGSLQ